MRFALTEQLLREAREFSLRAACRDCFFWSERRGECWHGWPDEGQRSWPLATATAIGDAGDAAGQEAAFCKEFELR
ncbi:MAG: hypothetical protein R3B48_16355 [Kofleriaceae bacterium]